MSYVLIMLVTIGINVVNYLLASFTKWYAHFVGYDTLSEKYSTIMVCTFISSFVNTGIITLLTNADFTFAPFPFNFIPIT
jgi:hypothetical protein